MGRRLPRSNGPFRRRAEVKASESQVRRCALPHYGEATLDVLAALLGGHLELLWGADTYASFQMR